MTSPKIRVLTPIAAASRPAPRAGSRSVGGGEVRLGLLDNSKGNAGIVLVELARLLGEHLSVHVVAVERKHASSEAATPAQLEALRGCDLVLTGTGD